MKINSSTLKKHFLWVKPLEDIKVLEIPFMKIISKDKHLQRSMEDEKRAMNNSKLSSYDDQVLTSDPRRVGRQTRATSFKRGPG